MVIRDVPAGIIEKWQKTIDLMVEFFDVPVGMVVRLGEKELEVCVINGNGELLFSKGDSIERNDSLYCEAVFRSRNLLVVEDARGNREWEDNPMVEKGMISYLGCPLEYPDGTLFGALCVMDEKTRSFPDNLVKLLSQFRDLIESDLKWMVKEVNEKLDSRSNFKIFFNSVKDYLFVFSEDGSIIEVNRMALEKLGYSEKDIRGKSVIELHPAERRLEVIKTLEGMSAGDIEYCEIPLVTKEGTLIPVETSITHGKWDGVTAIFAVCKDITERISAIRALALSRNRLEAANSIALLGVVDWDLRQNHMSCSDQMFKIFQIDSRTFTGSIEEAFSNVHPEDKEILFYRIEVVKEKALKSIKEESGDYVSEEDPLIFRIVRSDGSIRICKALSTVLVENRIPVRLISSVMDITEEVESKEKIMRSEKMYRLLAENAADVIWKLDLSTLGFTYVSPSIFKMRGITVEEAMRESLEESCAGDSYNVIKRELDHMLERSRSGELDAKVSSRNEIRQRCKDGTEIWVEMSLSLIAGSEGEPGEILGVSRDITERKKIEDLIRQNEEQLSVIFDNAPAMMMLIDEDKEILKINHVGLQMASRSEEETLGFRPGDILKCLNAARNERGCGHSESCKTCKLRNTFDTVLRTGRNINKVEIELVTSRDTEENKLTILASATVVSKQPVKKMLVTIDDITERKKMENELIRAKEKAEESDRLKTAFLCNISHEIRTPLNGIIGFAELLTQKGIRDEQQELYSDIINDNTQQLLRIVNNILDISKIETGQLDLVESEVLLNSVIDDLYYIYSLEAKKKGLSLTVHKPATDDQSKILADPYLLRQVIDNLLSNAVKFTIAGGIDFGYDLRGSWVYFHVKDTGIGISRDNYNVIFDRFRQLEYDERRTFGGNGLGLSLSKAYVQNLGGKIWLESEPGEGTTFYFKIPLVRSDSPFTPVDSRSLNEIDEELKGENLVLVVEDEEINYLYTEEVLRRMGIKVLWARTGEEALTLYRSNPSIDLVLMDIKLPDINGYEVTRMILEINKETIIIAQTAYAMTNDREQALSSGCADYLSKPVKAEILRGTLLKYIGKS